VTESEWNTCTEPRAMLAFLHGRCATERKLRLFAVACCRRVWPLLTDERSRNAVEVAERFADGWATEKERATAERDAFAVNASGYQGELEWFYDGYRPGRPTPQYLAGEAAVGSLCSRPEQAAAFASGRILEATGGEERAAQAGLLRDIFGPLPFRAVPLSPTWITTDVESLAQRASEDRELPSGNIKPENLGALASALQEAGCTDAELLGHLVGAGRHVRGCHVVDAVLRRE
jgi:hypothetical protein